MPQDAQITFRLPKDLIDWYARQAAAQHQSTADLLRSALTDYRARQGRVPEATTTSYTQDSIHIITLPPSILARAAARASDLDFPTTSDYLEFLIRTDLYHQAKSSP